MRVLLNEIRGTNRPIITNFPVLMGPLADALQKEYGETFNIIHRITFIDEREEIRNFYRIRSQSMCQEKDWLVQEYDAKKKPIGFDIQGAFDSGGVFYLLDEVHLVFGAREWQDMGRACIFYASQHRKLNDDVYLISQLPKQVDGQFRGLAQDFTVLRNHGMEKFFGFKQPDIFTRKTYFSMPTGSSTDTPLETGRFFLNLKWADCYETARGMGLKNVEGGSADKGKDKRSGLRWYWGLVIFFVVCVVLVQVVSRAPKAFFGYASGKGEGNGTESNSTAVERYRTAIMTARAEKAEEQKQGGTIDVSPKGNLQVIEGETRDVPPDLTNVGSVKIYNSTNFVEGYLVTSFRGKNQARFRLTNGAVLSTGTGSILEVRSDGIVNRYGELVPFNPRVRFDLRELYGTPER